MNYVRLDDCAIPVPEGWSDRTQLIIVADGREGDQFRPNVVMVRESTNGQSLKQLVETQLDALRETFDGFTITRSEHADFGPNDGELLEYKFTVEGREYRQIQFYVQYGDMFYTLTYSGSSETYGRDLPLAYRIFRQTQIGAPSLPGDEFLDL
jgi:hypothetical protein